MKITAFRNTKKSSQSFPISYAWSGHVIRNALGAVFDDTREGKDRRSGGETSMKVARSLVRPSSESLSVLRRWQMWLFDIYFQSVPKRQDVAACQRCIRCNRKAGITVDPAVPNAFRWASSCPEKVKMPRPKHVIAMRAAVGPANGPWDRSLAMAACGHGSWRTVIVLD